MLTAGSGREPVPGRGHAPGLQDKHASGSATSSGCSASRAPPAGSAWPLQDPWVCREPGKDHRCPECRGRALFHRAVGQTHQAGLRRLVGDTRYSRTPGRRGGDVNQQAVLLLPKQRTIAWVRLNEAVRLVATSDPSSRVSWLNAAFLEIGANRHDGAVHAVEFRSKLVHQRGRGIMIGQIRHHVLARPPAASKSRWSSVRLAVARHQNGVTAGPSDRHRRRPAHAAAGTGHHDNLPAQGLRLLRHLEDPLPAVDFNHLARQE